jgi:hypothetical protein
VQHELHGIRSDGERCPAPEPLRGQARHRPRRCPLESAEHPDGFPEAKPSDQRGNGQQPPPAGHRHRGGHELAGIPGVGGGGVREQEVLRVGLALAGPDPDGDAAEIGCVIRPGDPGGVRESDGGRKRGARHEVLRVQLRA